MANSIDMALIKALEGAGKVLGIFSVYCIRRKGHLLLALPAGRDAALVTMSLYQPQSLSGKAMSICVRGMVRVGLHKLLPCQKLRICEDGPFAAKLGERDNIGFLLGNPEGAVRRAIVVHPEKGDYVVDKVGVNEEAMAAVVAERDVIKELPNHLDGFPKLRGECEGAGWASYRVGYFQGRSPRRSDDDRILKLLWNWMKTAAPVSLGKTEQWAAMADEASNRNATGIWDKLSEVSTVEIKLGVMHGDFAPWNLKVSKNGRVFVLDWEYGCMAGPVGWDWLHYMIQREALVEGACANEILNKCRCWAETTHGKQFLIDAGWSGYTELWIGSYLVYSAWVAGFDREQLLQAWMEK